MDWTGVVWCLGTSVFTAILLCVFWVSLPNDKDTAVDVGGRIGVPNSKLTLVKAIVATVKPVLRGFQRPRQVPTLSHTVANVKVDRDLVARLAAIAGRSDGIGDGDVCPLVYWHVASFPMIAKLMSNNNFPFGLMGSVHMKCKLTYDRAVLMSDTVAIHARILRAHHHRRGTEVVCLVTVMDSGLPKKDSTVYLSIEHSFLFFEKVHDALPEGGTERMERAPDVMDFVAEKEVKLEADVGSKFAKVTGDYNPIHVSPTGAKLFGMKGMIVHGMCLVDRMVGTIMEAAVAEAAGTPSKFTMDDRAWRDLLKSFRVQFFVCFLSPITIPNKVDVQVTTDASVPVRSTKRGGSDSVKSITRLRFDAVAGTSGGKVGQSGYVVLDKRKR